VRVPARTESEGFEAHWHTIVVAGALTAGDRLPSERQLAERLQISRGKVREMLKVWETEGRVFVRPGAGCFLRTQNPLTRNEVLQVLGAKMRVGDIFEVRRGLEVTGVRLATLRANASDIQTLEALLAQMQVLAEQTGTASFAGFIEADQAFHRALLEATQNPLYGILFQALSPVLEEVSWNASQKSGARQHAVEYHRKLVQAIRQKNPELGAAVMELHLSDAEELLATVLAERELDPAGPEDPTAKAPRAEG
jgi:GntR family transcriptional repressor for pyruvate dehydrogenase complex